MANVLVACEESQEVCKAFRAKGHRAFSCDVQECSGGYPEWHIQGDCLPLLNGECVFSTADGVEHLQTGSWDLVIAHPPCTDLSSSGARWFPEKQKDFRQQKAVAFFMQMICARSDRIAVENPVGIMSRVYRKPDQIIHPFQYGHPVKKATCFWLKGLPELRPTEIIETVEDEHGFSIGGALRFAVDERGKAIQWNDSRTAKARSRTFRGVAQAMAEQWGVLL